MRARKVKIGILDTYIVGARAAPCGTSIALLTRVNCKQFEH